MISPLTNIHPDAKIAEGVVVEAFTTIQKNVEIGEGTWIGPNVTIMEGARIGKHCKIFPGAVISAVPQDLKYAGEDTTVIIGDHTVIRECATINRGTTDRMHTKVGSHCLLMAYVHLAHDVVVGDHCIFSNAVQVAGHVTVDDWAIVGGTTAIHQFVHIGKHAFIGGGSLVRKDVPPFMKAAKEPLSYAGVNSVGLSRRGFSSEEINQIHDIYRRLYTRGTVSAAIEHILAEVPASPVRDEIISFVQGSERGIIRGY